MNKEVILISLEVIEKLFTKFRSVYGPVWTNRHKSDEDWQDCAQTWFEELQCFNFEELRNGFKESIKAHKDYPPTLPQLVDCCMARTGVIGIQACIDLAVRGDFSNPIVKYLYDKVGSWNFRHDSASELMKKCKQAYPEALNKFKKHFLDSRRQLEHGGST